MDYRYNFRFLDLWMARNNINMKQVLEAFGTQDFRSMNDWRDGKRALPLGMLLRLCNTFQIPLEQFFFDLDGTAAQGIRKPTDGDQTEPTGGYPKDNERKNRQGIDPKAKFRQPTEMPEEYPLMTDATSTTHDDTPTPPATKTDDKPRLLTDTVEVLQMKIAHQQEVMSLQQSAREREDGIRSEFVKRNEKLRDKLYGIIESQQNTINKLADELADAQRKQGMMYAPPAINEGNIAAEERDNIQKKSV